jgi:asparagine synthase (glutamine-hydrolysing)
MCGFSVLQYPTHQHAADLYKLHDKFVAFRGRDAAASLVVKNLFFKHNRLEIIGGAAGAQPHVVGDSVLVFNGEVHNFKELASELEAGWDPVSDTVVLHEILLRQRHELFARIEGFFAFVFYDVRREALVVGRDIYGEKPLFYNENLKSLRFSSSMNVVSDLTSTPILSCFKYLASRKARLNPRTLYPFAKEVRPGSILFIDYKTRQLVDRIDLLGQMEKRIEKLVNSTQFNFDEAFEKVFNRAVACRTIADFPIAIALSGGVDSTAVATSLYKQQLNGQISAYTVQCGDKTLDETPTVRVNSSLMSYGLNIVEDDSNWKPIIMDYIKCLEYPIWDFSFLSFGSLYRAASRHNKVIIEGHGPDELVGGYDDILYVMATEAFCRLRFAKAHEYLTMAKRIRNSRIKGNLYLRFAMHLARATYKSYRRNLDGYFAFYKVKLNEVLRAFDRISMLHGIESRSPFLSIELFCLLKSLPISSRVSTEGTKQIIRRYIHRSVSGVSLPIVKIGFTSSWAKSEAPARHVIDEKNSSMRIKALVRCIVFLRSLSLFSRQASLAALSFLAFYAVAKNERQSI